MNSISRILLAAALLSLSACGDDSLSEEDAQKGFNAANLVLMQGGSAAQSSAANGVVAIDFTYNCLEGGTAKFVGNLDETDNATSTEVTFDYAVTFVDCKSQGITISGEVDYNLNVSASETASVMEYAYLGNIVFTGEVDGNCDLDMYARVNTTNDGQSANVGYEFRGNMCGNEADSMNVSGNYNVTY
jgi:hypothetical protein